MQMLALPAAALLACFLYPIVPQAASWMEQLLVRLHALILRAFTRESGRTDEGPALLTFILLLAGCAALLSAIHPLLEAIIIAPLLSGLSLFPGCAAIKAELDSGRYARDIPAYEARVRETCASFAPAFVSGVCAPLLVCAAGMPLHLGAALGWALAALRIRPSDLPLARQIISRIDRTTNAIFCAYLTLCSGVAGRSPFHTQGKDAQARMMNILGVAGDSTDTHAPVAGDISQAAFLCCFSAALLLLSLTLIGFVLC